MNLIFCRRALYCIGMMIGGVVAANPWAQSPVDCYEVPAMSSVQRLPSVTPTDGTLSNQLYVVAAQGEFEPASFVMVPKANVAKLELKAQALKGPGGVTIPVENVDIKVVKTWYQAGTAWYGYFADANRKELVPELLLNDENLVRVDHEKQVNYLRVGQDYVLITAKAGTPASNVLNRDVFGVEDAKTLQPVRLQTGENKQIWVTVKVPENARPGNYSGPIQLVADGRPAGTIHLNVRVLPFQLPNPKTYYNLDNDFLVTLYNTSVLYDNDFRTKPAGDPARKNIERIQKLILQNVKDHNVFNPMSRLDLDTSANEEQIRTELRLMKEMGINTRPFISSIWGFVRLEVENSGFPQPITRKSIKEHFEGVMSGRIKDPALQRAFDRIEKAIRIVKDELGHDEVYVSTWDEAPLGFVLIMREMSEYLRTKGVKIWATVSPMHYKEAAYAFDYVNKGGWPTREQAALWHASGAKIASYASPHTGPENPDVFRRWEGMARYKANFDGSFNYKYMDGWDMRIWNDFDPDSFRRFALIYPTNTRAIDTLAWEGFREGIDDIRYATKLKQVAAEAIAGGKVSAVHEARRALTWLEVTDEKTTDLNSMRLEMIAYILKIQAEMRK